MSSNPFSSDYGGSLTTQAQIAQTPRTAPVATTTTPLTAVLAAAEESLPQAIEIKLATYTVGKPRRVITRGKIARD